MLMGMALRMGCMIFGAFRNIYTDNGKPEESRYIMGIMREMRALGMEAFRTSDAYADVSGADPEEVVCRVDLPGTHRKAIVKNAKAKMIEGTFNRLEGILRDEMLVPGYVKDLAGDPHDNDIDEDEIRRLAASEKLLTFREFTIAVFKAMDFYNQKKPHRGVLKEWAWKPRPKAATPADCLRICYETGEWEPVRISQDVIDLVFLPKTTRIIDKGRIRFRNYVYENHALVTLTGQRSNAVMTRWIRNGCSFFTRAGLFARPSRSNTAA